MYADLIVILMVYYILQNAACYFYTNLAIETCNRNYLERFPRKMLNIKLASLRHL